MGRIGATASGASDSLRHHSAPRPGPNGRPGASGPVGRPQTTTQRRSMKTRLTVLMSMLVFAGAAAAQQPGGGGGGGQAREEAPRTIEGINSVWIAELTQPELRDMIREGYTTAL